MTSASDTGNGHARNGARDGDGQITVSLADLAGRPQWVAWRNEERGGKPTKVPYCAPDRQAEADNPDTWLSQDRADVVAQAIINGSGGGIGIELGPCGDLWLAGIDLDASRDPVAGNIETWAQTVLDRFNTYAEISPSLSGCKGYFLIDPRDIAAVRAMMGTQHGRRFKRHSTNGRHPPAIELHISHHYFAVTWETLEDAPTTLRIVPLDDLRWFIEEMGPAFAGKPKADDPETNETILMRLNRAASHTRLIGAALRNAATMKGGSRSEGSLGLGCALKRAGWPYEDMKAALLACPATREWAHEKQRSDGDRSFLRIWQREGEKPESDEPAQSDVLFFQPPITPITQIAPRQWAYGRFLLFGSAAVIGALDGTGKGYIAVAIILAFVSGRGDILGEKVWRKGPVGIVTYEDGIEEWQRRIAAGCLQHKLDYETVMKFVHFIIKSGGRVVFGQNTRDGIIFPDGDSIARQLKAGGFVLLLIDPFNNAHAMDDGNNNVAIAAVAAEMSRIALAANVALLVLHHLRKGAVGDPDDLMGAIMLRANFRSCRILKKMTAEEAGQLGLPVKDAFRYIRISGTKENYDVPLDKAVWFKLETIPLGNPAGIYTEGDWMGAAVSWEPPAMFDGMNVFELHAVFAAIEAKPHAKAKQTTIIPWVGRPLVDTGNRSEGQATAIVKAWTSSGVLIPGPPHKATNRTEIQTLATNPPRVAEILSTYRPGVFDD